MTDLRDEEDTEGETLTLQDVLRNRNYRAALEVWLNANHCYENLAFYNAVEFFKSVHGNVRPPVIYIYYLLPF